MAGISPATPYNPRWLDVQLRLRQDLFKLLNPTNQAGKENFEKFSSYTSPYSQCKPPPTMASANHLCQLCTAVKHMRTSASGVDAGPWCAAPAFWAGAKVGGRAEHGRGGHSEGWSLVLGCAVYTALCLLNYRCKYE